MRSQARKNTVSIKAKLSTAIDALNAISHELQTEEQLDVAVSNTDFLEILNVVDKLERVRRDLQNVLDKN